MAKGMEQAEAQPHVSQPGRYEFTLNPDDPSKSYICDKVKQSCTPMSLQDFHDSMPNYFEDYRKLHPEHEALMKKLDGNNAAVLRLPLTTIEDLSQGKPGRPRKDITLVGGEADVLPLVVDRRPRLKREGDNRDGRVDNPTIIPLELHPSVRGERLDTTLQWRRDASGKIVLDPNGSSQFDPERRIQFGSNGRVQLRVRGDQSDLMGVNNPNDPLSIFRPWLDRGGYGDRYGDRYGQDPFRRRDPLEALLDPLGSRRRNGLDALLDPTGRNRNGLDALLDPMGRNRRLDNPFNLRRRESFDPFGSNVEDSLYVPPLRLPGQSQDRQLRLDNNLSAEELNRRYQRGGLEALPPDVQQQLIDQIKRGQVEVVPAVPVVKPPEVKKPPEPQKPVEPPEELPKPLEQPKKVEPAQPIDGPKPPGDLETRPADVPADGKDNGEKLDAFGQSIKDTGAYTIDNFGQAYKEAAKNGAGVAIMVVGRGIAGSEEAIKNVKKLQEENPKLKFLIVDRDKVDAAVKADPNNAKMKEWQNWIDTSIKACGGSETNKVLTSVQSLKADSTGHPAPEKVTSFHWNANINQEIAAKAALASDATASHAKEFRLSLNSEEAKALNAQIKAAREEALNTRVGDLASMQARQEKFVKALQAASQARPDLLAQRRTEIEAIKDDAVKQQELQNFYELQNAPRLLRAELGLDMVRSAGLLPKQEKKAAMREAGLSVLRDAYKNAPELNDSKEFAEALKAAGVDVAQLIKESQTAPSISADQIKDKLANAYKAGDPVKVTEKRTEYSANVTPEMRAAVQQNRGRCYRDNCVAQQCCNGGVCRTLCGCPNTPRAQASFGRPRLFGRRR